MSTKIIGTRDSYKKNNFEVNNMIDIIHNPFEIKKI